MLGDPIQGILCRTGSYYNRAKLFEEVYADALTGDDDQAVLLDSASADLLQAESNWACLTNVDVNTLYQAGNFDGVTATATTGTNRKRVLLPLAFLLTLQGPWEDL